MDVGITKFLKESDRALYPMIDKSVYCEVNLTVEENFDWEEATMLQWKSTRWWGVVCSPEDLLNGSLGCWWDADEDDSTDVEC